MTKLEIAISVIMGMPLLLWVACEVVNAQWLLRKRFKKRGTK